MSANAISEAPLAKGPSRDPSADAASDHRTAAQDVARNAAQDAATETYSITDLAEEFAITTRAIRFYEDKGLISPSRNGINRVYSRRDRGRLKLVLRGKRLGFSLADIREMLDLYNVGDGQCEQLRVLEAKVKDRLAALHRQRHDIEEAIAELEEGQRQIEAYLNNK